MKNTISSLTKKASMMLALAVAMTAFSTIQALATTFLVNPPEDNGYAACTAPTTPNFTVSTINTATNVALTGDIVYVCPKYATAGAGAGAVVAYNETLDIINGVNLQGINDNRGGRVVLAANPTTNGLPAGSGQPGIVVIRGAGATFGNFVVDGAVGAANGVGPAGTVTTTTTNYAGTGNYNGIVVAAGAAGAIIYSNTIQDIRSGQTSNTNSDGDGITIIGTGTAAATAAGTSANPVQINNNIVQNFRADGISAGTNSYVFARGNYLIGTGNGRINGVDQVGQTANQAGVQFTSTANGDIFNNRMTNLAFSLNTTRIGAGCDVTTIEGCPGAVVLETTGSANGNSLRVRYNTSANDTYGVIGTNFQFVNINNNTLYGNANDGIVMTGSAFNLGSNFNTVTLNTIVSSRRSGILLGLPGGDASLGNTITQNTIQDTYSGVANNSPAVNNTISTSGATANTFISVNLFVNPNGGGTSNPLP